MGPCGTLEGAPCPSAPSPFPVMQQIPRDVGQGQPQPGGGAGGPLQAALSHACPGKILGTREVQTGGQLGLSAHQMGSRRDHGGSCCSWRGVRRPPPHQQQHHHFPSRFPKEWGQSAPLQQGPAPLAGNWPDARGGAAASLTQSWENGPCLTPPCPPGRRDTRALEPDLVQGQTDNKAPGSCSAAGGQGRGRHHLPLPRPALRTLWPELRPHSGPSPSPRPQV